MSAIAKVKVSPQTTKFYKGGKSMIVVWTKKLLPNRFKATPTDYTDHWAFFDNHKEAKKHYDYLIGLDSTWTASICSVVESTDYELEDNRNAN